MTVGEGGYQMCYGALLRKEGVCKRWKIVMWYTIKLKRLTFSLILTEIDWFTKSKQVIKNKTENLGTKQN